MSSPRRSRWMPASSRAGLVLLMFACGLVVATAPPSSAVAQDATDMQKAKQRFRKGRTLYEQGRHLDAAKAFKEAYELSNRGELLYNIGKSYEKADKPRKAETYYQKYLEREPDADNADEVVQTIITLQEKIAARMSTVEITSTDDGRDVFVDDEKKPRCQTPCSVSLYPGDHTITVRGEGMKPTERTIDVGKSESTTVAVKLKPDIQPGRLAVSTGGQSGVLTIRGEGERSLPLDQPASLDPGSYRVSVRGESGSTWKGDVAIKDDETTRLTVPLALLNDTSSSGGTTGGTVRRGFAYGLLGASAALIGGGLVMGMQANTTHDALATEQKRFGGVDPRLLQKGRSEQRIANILLGVGGGAFLTGGSLFVWDLLSGSSSSPPTPPTRDLPRP